MDNPKTNATIRFTNRVANYVKYRPTYPDDVINYLAKECRLSDNAIIADVGSGTGMFSALLLQRAYTVYGVEPNNAMRQWAENTLCDGFTSVNGTAEATTLPDKSADLLVCAQAFHWFNPIETRKEFARILKDDTRLVALIWNNRLTSIDEFSKAYENLLEQKATDYSEVNHQHLKGVDFEAFYKDGKYTLAKFTNKQVFDFDGLAGRAFSSSYVQAHDTEDGKAFALLLKAIFDRYEQNGFVEILYETEGYLGRI